MVTVHFNCINGSSNLSSIHSFISGSPFSSIFIFTIQDKPIAHPHLLDVAIPLFVLSLSLSLISKVLTSLHDHTTSGHLGVIKTLHIVQGQFYCPDQCKTIKVWCKSKNDHLNLDMSLYSHITLDFHYNELS